MNKRYWLRGGLVGGLIFIVVAIIWWIFVSTEMNCIIEPINSINLGGGTCHYNNYGSFSSYFALVITSLFYFGVPTILGFIIGLPIGWLYGKIKNRNKIN